MNVGSGEASEQVVRMMLSGGEVAIRLTGSAAKNAAAMLLALRKNHKKIYGRTNMVKLLKQTRDIRTFTMTPAQYRQFQRHSRYYKILYAGVQDERIANAPIDLVLPVSDIDRANLVFEKIRYAPQQPEQTVNREEAVKKKEHQPAQNSRDTRDKSYTHENSGQKTKKNEKSSVEEKLRVFKAQQAQKQKSAPVRNKTRPKGKVK